MQTPATTALDAAGVEHRITEYVVDDTDDVGYGLAVAAMLGLDPDSVGKTMVAVVDTDRFVVAVVPVSGSLDLKALARAAGGKRAAMADVDDAERLTGSVVGGISPFGLRRPLPVFVDELLTIGAAVHVSGGRRGLEITLTPEALVAVADATVVPITH